MILLKACVALPCLFCMQLAFGQQIEKKKITAKRITALIKIDGEINEPDWKTAAVADKFIALRPTPFQQESTENATEVYFLYNDDGIYVGGYLHEKIRDSISHELVGRDGFGNNDFIGVVFDTYYDKINGFEYFVTPLGEQFDAKQAPNSNGNSEDFGWNAVWESASAIHNDGWSFEMFIPYSAIRFGKNKIQDWGLNIVRKRQKSGQQLFWQSLDPNVNGFLTQEGLLTGLENIKAPLRLQFSPYFSAYQNHDGNAAAGKNKNSSTFNGGVDIKYGLSPAFTLDMTLIPDFGQVQTDNLTLNLTPFEQKFNDNRPFFTEGGELFNKGNLFYSRRIPVKLFNATKISGRTQKGLGIGILNAIAKPEYEIVKDDVAGKEEKIETKSIANYNIFVLDQTMKHNSSISFVNTNVWRSGKEYDANVSSALFDLYDKKNTWNINGNFSISNKFGINDKPITGYAHSIYMGKVSGRFNFQVWQELTNDTYDKNDLGYYTNNNSMDQGIWAGYNWSKPGKWYNQLRLNANVFYSRLMSPVDVLRRSGQMYQNAGMNINANGQLKNLWWVGFNINGGPARNDFYEPRRYGTYGRVFKDKGRINLNLWWETNNAKKVSWGGSLSMGHGWMFGRNRFDGGLFAKVRFSSKFSINHQVDLGNTWNQAGWASIKRIDPDVRSPYDTIIFSRRTLHSVENVLTLKYNFTNRMGLTLRARHYWSKVDPQQFYQLDLYGDLKTPATPFAGNANQNYNFISMDMVYTWQFAQGSFINVMWKNINENFNDHFEKNYFGNFGKTMGGDGYNNLTQFSSFSIKVIYFLDYLTVSNKAKHRNRKV